MSVTPEDVRRALATVLYPGSRHDVVRAGVVRDVSIEGSEATVVVVEPSTKPEVNEEIRRRIASAVTSIEGLFSVRIATAAGEGPGRPDTDAKLAIPGVGAILAVSSAKGGVGKSTVAVNLAMALHASGARVGLLDADVYGPSVPIMLGIAEKPASIGGKVVPLERYGVRTMSMGYFLDDDSPVIWRGPMVMSLVRQFLQDVAWGDLDVLVIDMPPGTGDAALTLAQLVPLTGAVIVTTPQDVALVDVERGVSMFRQLQVPVLGVVENMAGYACPSCGEVDEVFGAGAAAGLDDRFGLDLLARLPLAPEVRIGGDAGAPIVVADGSHPVSVAFGRLAAEVTRRLQVSAASG